MSLPLFQMFEQALAERGWFAGKNVVLEYRFPRTEELQFGEAAEELARLKVDVIYASSAPALRAAYAVTRATPIVTLDFSTDPIAAGYVESYSRPGGNVTGVFLDAPEFASKWIEILRTLRPGLSRIMVLWDPSPGPVHLQGVQGAAKSLGIKVQVVEIRKPDDIERAFSTLRGRPQAVVQLPSPLMYAQSARVGQLVEQHRLLGVSIWRRFAEAGGTVSYGPDFREATRRSAAIVAKILDGAKPADLPIERPAKFEFILNVKAVKALGLPVPDELVLRADELIR